MPTPILSARGLTKNFGVVCASDAVDLDLVVGECVGLIGPNGAGKSTLLAMLAGSRRADAGRLYLDGENITNLPLHRRVKLGIARASQIPQTFDRLDVFQNVHVSSLFGADLRGQQAQESTDEVLALCGLDAQRNRSAAALGLLDRKRLELAKAVAARPKTLLLDEVAAGLTEPEIEAIMALVIRLKSGRAVIWVEHIPFALRGVCERLVVMNEGTKILDGAMAEVWDDPLMHEIYMGVPDADVAEY